MSIAEKLTTVAENIPKVYEAGQRAEHERFWDNYLRYGSYWVYRFAGWGWDDNTFQPTKDIVVTGNATGLFRETAIVDLAKCLTDNKVILDVSGVTNASYLFGFSNIVNISMKISEPNEDSSIAFVSTSFQSCTKLTTLSITGTLATNGLDLHWSTDLDHESLLNIIECLKDYSADTSGTDWYITIGNDNIAKLTEAEIQIAKNKGWDVI